MYTLYIDAKDFGDTRSGDYGEWAPYLIVNNEHGFGAWFTENEMLAGDEEDLDLILVADRIPDLSMQFDQYNLIKHISSDSLTAIAALVKTKHLIDAHTDYSDWFDEEGNPV
ncbi:hypothetical protein PYDG_00031 [Pseudoalteromonas phage pYD6-A]|uniref:Uncharacterized protein n=1 Tax=Pseudoalteromonas phage pYD6-A TaxID=754052 RepID=M4SNE6_9CAUD|nr:hypothetical protein PYDG_00031 [Pseudoalteromonas phage pYD6-A]AGH57563.1 hypothetical protein PYDG_00031 [Pseudoalteromonas phage pYD6-A]